MKVSRESTKWFPQNMVDNRNVLQLRCLLLSVLRGSTGKDRRRKAEDARGGVLEEDGAGAELPRISRSAGARTLAVHSLAQGEWVW